MRRPTEKWIALIAVTAAGLYLCWLIIAPFVAVLLWAGVLAMVSYPYYRRWRRRGTGPAAAAGITTAVVVLVVLVPLTLVTLALVRQAAPAAEGLQRAMRSLLNPESPWFQYLEQYVDLEELRDPQFIGQWFRGVTAAIAARTLGFLGGFLGAVIQIVFVLFALFYMLRDADRIVLALRSMLPLEDAEIDEVFRRTHEVISASIYGVLVIAAVQGTLGGLAFWVLGIRAALLWGVVMFLLSMIPLAGAFIVWVPAAIFLAFTGHWVKALLLTIWGAGVIGTIDNLMRPRLVGGRARLHELIVFFSVLGGLHVFGVLGLVVGPVVVAITISLIDVLRRVNRQAPAVPAASVSAAPASSEPAPVVLPATTVPEPPMSATSPPPVLPGTPPEAGPS